MMTTQELPAQEREAFEAWWKAEPRFDDRFKNAAFRGWQARARLAAQVEPIARAVVQRIDPEALILACVPGGYSCDPQAVADAIRAYCDAPQAVQQSDADPLTKLTRLSEEMGLYDAPVPGLPTQECNCAPGACRLGRDDAAGVKGPDHG